VTDVDHQVYYRPVDDFSHNTSELQFRSTPHHFSTSVFTRSPEIQ